MQVPWEGERDPLYIEVFQGAERASFEQVTQDQGWSVFFIDAKGYAIVQHASDYSPVTAENPAHPGEYLIAYGINLGPVRNQPSSGRPAPFDPLAAYQPTASTCRADQFVRIGGTSSPTAYVGLTPGTVGVYQINFQVSELVSSGDTQLQFERTLVVNPFGQCLGSGMGSTQTTTQSRPALLPVRR